MSRVRRLGPLAAVLLVSMVLRVALALSGGQYYWPDERRYGASRDVVRLLLDGRIREGLAGLDSANHPLFRAIGVVPALIEFQSNTGDDGYVPALFFGLFSTINIWLIARIARRLGADRVETFFAFTLAALSCSLFYWARHLMAYDAAMTFGLAALYVGARTPPRPWSSVLCGVFAACAFLTYMGYWTLGGAALLVHVAEAQRPGERATRAFLGGVGLLATLGAALGASAALGGGLLRGIVAFSGSINQGSYAEGWRLPFAYLWHAEHVLLIAWVAGVVWCVFNLSKVHASRRVVAGLLGLAFIYGSLVIFSVLLGKFVVYGRLARQMIPFFCLLTAATLQQLRTGLRARGSLVVSALLLLLVVQAAWNFAEPLRMSFPRELQKEANDRPGAIAVNAYHIYPRPEPVHLPAHYVVLREARHPLQFLPYQYEGHTPAERDLLRSTDIRMRLLMRRE
jgi:hypothetical protein